MLPGRRFLCKVEVFFRVKGVTDGLTPVFSEKISPPHPPPKKKKEKKTTTQYYSLEKLEEFTLPYDQIVKKLRITCTARYVLYPVIGRIG